MELTPFMSRTGSPGSATLVIPQRGITSLGARPSLSRFPKPNLQGGGNHARSGLATRFAGHPRRGMSSLFLLSFLLLCGLAGAAMACPACKDAIANDPNGPKLTRGWARSIYLLMWTPYLLFGGVTFAIVRSARRNRENR